LGRRVSASPAFSVLFLSKIRRNVRRLASSIHTVQKTKVEHPLHVYP
jgi:hypothetical protein